MICKWWGAFERPFKGKCSLNLVSKDRSLADVKTEVITTFQLVQHQFFHQYQAFQLVHQWWFILVSISCSISRVLDIGEKLVFTNWNVMIAPVFALAGLLDPWTLDLKSMPLKVSQKHPIICKFLMSLLKPFLHKFEKKLEVLHYSQLGKLMHTLEEFKI